MRRRLTLAALMTAAIFVFPGVSSSREGIRSGGQGAQSAGPIYGEQSGAEFGRRGRGDLSERGSGTGRNIYGRGEQGDRAVIGRSERGYERYGRYGSGRGSHYGRSAPEAWRWR